MQTKVSPVVVGVAAVVLIAFCVFMYMRANSSASPQQLPPSGEQYKPGYTGSDSNAGPRNRSTNKAAPGAPAGTTGQ